MFQLTSPAVNAFRRDVRGAVAMTFGVMFMRIVLCMGVAVDYARIHHSYSRITSAADAAAIAAGKGLLDGRLTVADIEQMATEFFYANLRQREGYATIHSFRARVNRAQQSVEVDVEAEVPMTIMKVAGFTKVDIPVTSVAIFDQKDIEVALAVDLTGSMCSGGDREPCLHAPKIDALKAATDDLLNILLPDGGTPNKVRVGVAPFSAGVNAGSYARDVTGLSSPPPCTIEREGIEPEGDQAPSTNNYLKSGGACPPGSPVIALTSDKTLLSRTVNNYRATGTTAGHLGAQWASYLVSPNCGTIWGSEGRPAAYNDGKTIKAAIFMTDGKNNTFGGINNERLNRPRSDALFRDVCAEMRSHQVRVYTIGLSTPSDPLDTTAINLLRDCAGDLSHAYLGASRDELRQAFSNIA